MDQVATLKYGPLARQIITDTLGFEPVKNKPFVFSDSSKTGNDYLHCEGDFYCVKNFATGKAFSSIDVYMLKTNTDFTTAISDLSARYLNGSTFNGNHSGSQAQREADRPKPFQPPVLRSVREFTTDEVNYWKAYGITGKVLQAFNVFASDAYFDYTWHKDKNDWHGFQVRPNEKNGHLIFAYKLSDTCYKIYRPLHTEKNKRFLWLGEKPDSFTDVWGVELIPDATQVIVITEGVKDALTINSHLNCFEQKVWAIAKENAGNLLDTSLVDYLKSRYSVLLCLDADTPGKEASEKHSQAHRLQFIDLQSFIVDELGYDVSPELKDVSDVFRLAHAQLMEGEQIESLSGVFTGLIEKALNQPLPVTEEPAAADQESQPESEKASQTQANSLLESLMSVEQAIAQYASQEIVFSPPLISRNEIGIFRRGTINTIQGKFGSHKSRLAELFCSLLLKTANCRTDFLGFKRQELTRFTVCYIDTERNLKEELPYAIQNVRRLAGHDKTDTVPNFRFTSLKQFERKDRLNALKTYIESVRASTTDHLFILLDVVTDCVKNFNKEDETLLLYDFLGNLCDKHEVTFLLVIHENPGSDKMRGHTGTEAANKASTAIQIGFEKGKNGEETQLIKIKYIKLRGAQKPEPVYVHYCDESKGLVAADHELIGQIMGERKAKADVELVKDHLEELLTEPMERQAMIDALRERLECSKNTIEERLKDIIENDESLYDAEGKVCRLTKEGGNGKKVIYSLTIRD